MREIYLFDPIKEVNLRKRGRTKKEMANDINIVNKLYRITKADAEREVQRFIEFIERAFANPRYMKVMLSYPIRFKLTKDGEIHELTAIPFLYFMVLAAPLVEKGVKLDNNYIFDPKPFTVSELEQYLDRVYLDMNKDKYTYEEMCEEFCFIRIQFDIICERIGDRLMLTFSLYDFIDLIHKSDTARDIMMVNYPFPKHASPREIERLANEKTEELVDIIRSYRGSSLEAALSAGVVNKGQFKELAVLIGNKPDLYGNTSPITSPTNNIKGFTDPAAYWTDSTGGKKAEVIKLNVADAGSFERSLTLLASDLRYVDKEYVCDSTYYLPEEIQTIKQLKVFEGRYYLFNPNDENEEFKIVNNKDKHLVNKTIYLKTPMTCAHPRYITNGTICRGCYTELLTIANQRIHIGMNSAYSASDDTQQVMLSGKHNLVTDTHDVEFVELFNKFFTLRFDSIHFSNPIIDDLADSDRYNNFYFVFNPKSIIKMKDGEIGGKNRVIPEIVVYDKGADEFYNIEEKSECKLYLSPDMNAIYKKFELQSEDNLVYVPFSYFVDEVDSCISLFEIEFKNNDLIEPLKKLDSIINTKKIKQFDDYKQLVDTVMPLFNKAGINMPQIHMEIIISRLIRTIDMQMVDWSVPNQQYQMIPYDAAILTNSSPVTSIIHIEAKAQLRGAYGFYNKRGKSIYDVLIKS